MKPQIVAFEAAGWHNADPTKSKDRLLRGGSYRNQSTVCIIPSLGAIHPKVVGAWMAMLTPMNQKFLRLWPMNMEIGDAYSSTIEGILADPELSKWKYVLTLETDNIPPPDGLIRLLETIEGGVDGRKYDVVGSLYWTKGHGGQPMIYGNPGEFPLSFVPQVPVPNAIQPCHGLGMGFT
ncbi:MAG: hypothetical protein ACRDHG_13745, partial [Anaerolineales bacterium]